jgi:hypothetical protein
MNKRDINNLKFLLSLSAKDMTIFVSMATEDDLKYVEELFTQARAGVVAKILEQDMEVDTLEQTKEYLRKFTLKG